MISRLFRQQTRTISSALVLTFITQLSPLPVLAATTPRSERASSRSERAPPAVSASSAERIAVPVHVVEQFQRDLALLESSGKEAYLDNLFDRMNGDEARARIIVRQKIEEIGARKLTFLILGIGSPVLAGLIGSLPEPWQAAILEAGVMKFVGKTLRSVKGALVETPEHVLKSGLKTFVDRLGSLRTAGTTAALSEADQSWWERFFGNSTIVRNFIVTVVALASIGVAVGLAIAGSTAAPVVAVVGALVSLIALVISHDTLEAEGLAAVVVTP